MSRPQSDYTLRLLSLPYMSRLLWWEPSDRHQPSIGNLRATLLRLGIPFAEQRLGADLGMMRRLIWTLRHPTAPQLAFNDMLAAEGQLRKSLPGNVKLVLPGDTDPEHRLALEVGDFPTPASSQEYAPTSEYEVAHLSQTCANLRPGQGVRVRLSFTPDAGLEAAKKLLPETPDGFIALHPTEHAPIVDFWRALSRVAVKQSAGRFDAIAAAMGSGDSVLCPEGADRAYASALCAALRRAGRDNPVQRRLDDGRFRVWSTQGAKTAAVHHGTEFPAGGDVLVLEIGVPISRLIYPRKSKVPFESTFRAIEVGDVKRFTSSEYQDPEREARALCMSMRRRGWKVRAAKGPDDVWFVKCEGEMVAKPRTKSPDAMSSPIGESGVAPEATHKPELIAAQGQPASVAADVAAPDAGYVPPANWEDGLDPVPDNVVVTVDQERGEA